MLRREISNKIQRFIDSEEPSKPVLLIEGARQTGKTTALKMACENKNHLFIDLEKEKVLRSRIDECREFKEWEELLLDAYGFTPGRGQILVIDEAQESSQLGGFVRYMKEEWAGQTTILLGSLMSRLFRGGVREPVGRVRRIVVHPYSFREFLKTHEKTSQVEAIENWEPHTPLSPNRHDMLVQMLQKYLEVGGLPEVVEQHHQGGDWKSLLMQLKIQYEEDYVRVFGDAKLSIFQRILKRISETTGYPSKKTTFIESSQRGYQTLDDVLSQLERWHLIHRISQESYEPTRSGRLLPKRYLFDVGLCQLLGQQTRPAIDLGANTAAEVKTPLGGFLENFVLCELLHGDWNGMNGWRYKTNGSEIDFILRHGREAYPLEIKSSIKFRRDYLSPILNYLNLYNVDQGFLADLMPGGVHKEKGKMIYQIPLYCVSELGRILKL